MNHELFIAAIAATIGTPPLSGTPRWKLEFPHGGKLEIQPAGDHNPYVFMQVLGWPAESFPGGANQFTGVWNISPSFSEGCEEPTLYKQCLKELQRRLALVGYVSPGDPAAVPAEGGQEAGLAEDPEPYWHSLGCATSGGKVTEVTAAAMVDGDPVVKRWSLDSRGWNSHQMHSDVERWDYKVYETPPPHLLVMPGDLVEPVAWAYEVQDIRAKDGWQRKLSFDVRDCDLPYLRNVVPLFRQEGLPEPEAISGLTEAGFYDAIGRALGMPREEAKARWLAFQSELPAQGPAFCTNAQRAAGLVWNPMETAPKEPNHFGGHQILLKKGNERILASWDRSLYGMSGGGWVAWCSGCGCGVNHSYEIEEPEGWLPALMEEGDEEHPLWCLDAQIRGLLEGDGATEDLEAVKDFFRAAGLPESTAARVRDALCSAEVKAGL